MAGFIRESWIIVLPANAERPQVVDSIGGSDNERIVDYAESVVNVIRRDATLIVSARARRYPNASTVQLDCKSCGRAFVALAIDAQRDRTKYCSRSCGSRANALKRHAASPQAGHCNPNWRGGRSSRPYDSYVKHFKSANPEKVRAHQRVADAIRSGRLVRPATCAECAVLCRAEAHHDDYARPLIVRWLCRRCHRKADIARAQRPQQSVVNLLSLVREHGASLKED